ncbi:MAG TPA: molecular chaperone DnaK [Euryarchaeota archaeon]|nr:molecular chaperone DnaK [Euryarchaeota archaeon]
MAKILGIDLGTSNSAAAIIENGKPTIIPSAEGTTLGGKAFPSVVAFDKDGQVLVGEPARRQAVSNPEGTVMAIKRKMGTDHKVRIGGKEYTPQQISAFILQKIKRDSEAYIGDKVEKAVITVPAYFNDNQRQATKDAGAIAGLEVVRIINEPTAAALAYGIDKSEKDQKILVYDFGGGTLDVTVMEFGDGVFEVISTSGDTQLGGTDMDNVLVDYLVEQFKKEQGFDLRNDKMAMQRLREAAEKAKVELSSTIETEINLPYITADQTGPKHLTMKITRAKLEDLVNPIVNKCKTSIDTALSDAKLTPEKIDKIILVGGPTRMPLVQKFLENIVGPKIVRGVDPMECVAIGAAIQGAVMSGEMKDILLLDVTPLSLGVETLGGVFTRLIERNTTIPTRKSEIFTTATDSQTAVDIHVLQGERPMAGDNTSLGRFNLVGIPPAPRGVPQVEVAFDIDANGILNVSAKDLATGKQQAITITAATKLSKEDIDNMIHQAEQFADEDKKRREVVELKNQAETASYTADKLADELAEKIGEELKDKIKEKAKELRDAIPSGDAVKIKQLVDELNKLLQEAGTKAYQQAGPGAPGGPGAGGPGPTEGGGGSDKGGDDSGVVDADYRIVD